MSWSDARRSARGAADLIKSRGPSDYCTGGGQRAQNRSCPQAPSDRPVLWRSELGYIFCSQMSLLGTWCCCRVLEVCIFAFTTWPSGIPEFTISMCPINSFYCRRWCARHASTTLACPLVPGDNFDFGPSAPPLCNTTNSHWGRGS